LKASPNKLGLGLFAVTAHLKGTVVCYMRGIVVKKTAQSLQKDYIKVSKEQVP
jgi:hypothetical protein